MICCPQITGLRKIVTLLVIIGSSELLLLPSQMAKLRRSKEEETSSGGVYEYQQNMAPVATLNIDRLVPGTASRSERSLKSASISRLVPAASASTSRSKRLLYSFLEETRKQDLLVPPELRGPLSGRSYVVALGFWEQVLAATRNLLQMQCWASTLGSGFSVVQPFLLSNRSGLGFSFASDSTDVSKLGLDILFNMTTWARQWTGEGLLAPLVSREDLISEISQFQKSVVLVEVKYLSQDTKCDFTWNFAHVMEGLQQYQNLRVARKVCINVQKSTNPIIFRSLVFGDLLPQDSLIIFQEWRGLGPRRMHITPSSCFMQVDRHFLHLSDQVWKDAENYVNTHLGGVDQFVSTLARFEKMYTKYASLTLEQKQGVITLLIQQALHDVRELQRNHSVKNVYLTYDYGQFGSGSFKDRHYYYLENMLMNFQTDLYNGKISFAEYEESLKAFSYTHPAYVAQVQMAVASMGKCLVQIGWGHVINLIKELFMRTHQSPYCIKCISPGGCEYIS